MIGPISQCKPLLTLPSRDEEELDRLYPVLRQIDYAARSEMKVTGQALSWGIVLTAGGTHFPFLRPVKGRNKPQPDLRPYDSPVFGHDNIISGQKASSQKRPVTRPVSTSTSTRR